MNDQEINDNPIFGITCPNHHTTYFDKREVCPDSGTITRGPGQKLDKLWLKCPTCGAEMIADVDCEAYK